MIEAGFLYVGSLLRGRSYYENDGCLVNPSLPIKADPTGVQASLGYFVDRLYEHTCPERRWAFLQWNAGGRKDPDVQNDSLAIFLAGLERRLMIDRLYGEVSTVERYALLDELVRLMSLYQSHSHFVECAAELLVIDWLLAGGDLSTCSVYDKLENFQIGAREFQIQLAFTISKRMPLRGETMLRWLAVENPHWLKGPVVRCPVAFRKLFTQRFDATFGQGLVVKPCRTPLVIELEPMNDAVDVLSLEHHPPLPDPSELRQPWVQVYPIFESCLKDLDAYSRYLGREGAKGFSLFGLSYLPPELTAEFKQGREVLVRLQQWFQSKETYQMIRLDDLYREFGEVVFEKVLKQRLIRLAHLCDLLGYGIAPDPRFPVFAPFTQDQFLLFEGGFGADFEPSRDFEGMVPFVRMAAMLCRPDQDLANVIAGPVVQALREHQTLSDVEKRGLTAYFLWCFQAEQKTRGLRVSLKNIALEEKHQFGRKLLVYAHLGRGMSAKKMKLLERFYGFLGLKKDQVIADLHDLTSAGEPMLVANAGAATGYAIPRPVDETPGAKRIHLDPALVRAHREETEQVQWVLSDLFGDDTTEEKTKPMRPEPSPNTLAAQEFANTLDAIYRPLLHRLVTQASWPSGDFEAHAKSHGLMRNGAVEMINEWSFATLDAPLLEDHGDTLTVDQDLLEELRHGAS
ncbi:TerB N-terminal domain-containing protein [Acanthopleuribacter pedis]